MTPLALEGIRVVSTGAVWAAPYATKLLADMGAEVLKIESTHRWDWVRGGLDPPSGSGLYPEGEPGTRPYNRSGYFNKLNRNVLGLTLDLRQPRGKELYKRLVARADVVVENFSPRVMPQLGLDYAVLCQVKPDLIMVSMPAFGSTGPEASYLGYGAALEQLGGVVHLTGYAGGMPYKSGINYGDPVAGLLAAFAILAALRWRRHTGCGQWIDLSQREGLISLVGETILDYSMNGRIAQRYGNQHPTMAPHGCYPARGQDRWVTIAARHEADWQCLCEVLGHPAWCRQPRFATMADRLAHRDELDRHIAAWTCQQDAEQAAGRLQAVGIPAGAVLTSRDLVSNTHLKARHFWEVVTHAEAGTHPLPGPAWKMLATPGRVRFPAPRLGEHNRSILQGILGLSEAELDELKALKVIGEEAQLEE